MYVCVCAFVYGLADANGKSHINSFFNPQVDFFHVWSLMPFWQLAPIHDDYNFQTLMQNIHPLMLFLYSSRHEIANECQIFFITLFRTNCIQNLGCTRQMQISEFQQQLNQAQQMCSLQVRCI